MIDILNEMGGLWWMVGILVVALVGSVFWFAMKFLKGKKTVQSPEETASTSESEDEKTEEGGEGKTPPLYGVGDLMAYVLEDGLMKPTTIAKAIGDIFDFDPSMPVSGRGYFVKVENDALVPYDPREFPYDKDKNPTMAYFATHWESARGVYESRTPWWQSANVWITVGVLVILVIVTMIGLG